MALKVRTFVCEACGQSADRDLNAAKNILEAGRGLRTGTGRKTAARRPCYPAGVRQSFWASCLDSYQVMRSGFWLRSIGRTGLIREWSVCTAHDEDPPAY
jgi:hypothetical protein